MTRLLLALLILTTSFACSGPQRKESTANEQKDSVTIADSIPAAAPKKIKPAYKNVNDVAYNEKRIAWINQQNDSCSSCILHFNLKTANTLWIEYTPECWAIFPIKIVDDKIEVYWDTFIDSKYNFDIVKAMKKISPRYNGKAFMNLELINDSTLQASYPFPEIMKKLNASEKNCVLFPQQYLLKSE